MLNEGNIYLLDYIMKNLPNEGAILEIGSYGGLSTNLICYLLRKYKKENTFFSCDAWVYEGYEDTIKAILETIDGRDDIKRVDYMNYIKQSFINATLLLSKENLPYSIHSTSNTFFKNWALGQTAKDVFGRDIKLGGKIAFAYIDGDHSETAAYADFENVDKILLPKGFILLDDSADAYNFGSSKMMKTIKKNNKYKVVMTNPNYLLQKIS